MANAAIGWDNYVIGIDGVRNAVLYTPSAAAGLPLSNIQSPIGSPSTAWQTVASVVTSATGAWFGLETDNVLSMGALVLARTNLTTAATVRWVLDYSAAASPVPSSLQWDSGTVPAGVVKGFGQSVIIPPLGIMAGTVHCFIDDPTNPDGFINIPLVYIGGVWRPLSNLSVNTTTGRDDQTVETVTRGGQEFPLLYWQRRRCSMDFQSIRTSELWPYVDDLKVTALRNGNCLLVPDPDSPNIGRETIFGRVKSEADISYYQGAQDRRAWKATITERL